MSQHDRRMINPYEPTTNETETPRPHRSHELGLWIASAVASLISTVGIELTGLISSFAVRSQLQGLTLVVGLSSVVFVVAFIANGSRQSIDDRKEHVTDDRQGVRSRVRFER